MHSTQPIKTIKTTDRPIPTHTTQPLPADEGDRGGRPPLPARPRAPRLGGGQSPRRRGGPGRMDPVPERARGGACPCGGGGRWQAPPGRADPRGGAVCGVQGPGRGGAGGHGGGGAGFGLVSCVCLGGGALVACLGGKAWGTVVVVNMFLYPYIHTHTCLAHRPPPTILSKPRVPSRWWPRT